MRHSIASLLISYASAAPSSLPSSSTWPKFATIPSVTMDTDNNNVALAFSKNLNALGSNGGPVRGYRSNLVVFPTQMLVNPVASGNTNGNIIAHTTTRTFWQFESAKLGTQPDKMASNTQAAAC